jgi:hypothetical protein
MPQRRRDACVESGSIRSLRISFDPGELMQQLGAA